LELYISVNGAIVLPDGMTISNRPVAVATTFASLQTGGLVELRTGDQVGVILVEGTATTQTQAGYQWLSIKKEGGQY
jgi:hypothetical protein